LHLPDGFDDDALEGAAPTGMDGRDTASFGIDQENGDAVRGLHAEKETGTVGGGSIAAARLGGRGVEEMDYVGMDLFQRDEVKIGRVQDGLEEAAVFENVFSTVPFSETEVENFFIVQKTDAAGASAEAVDEPGELR
jgi:hypothetical protein